MASGSWNPNEERVLALSLQLPRGSLHNTLSTGFSFNLIRQSATLQGSVCQPRPFSLRPEDFPFIPSRYQPHLAPRSPPAVHLSRKSSPQLFACNHLSKVVEQRLINIPCGAFHQIVRMGKEADQSVSLSDQRELLFPKIYRI